MKDGEEQTLLSCHSYTLECHNFQKWSFILLKTNCPTKMCIKSSPYLHQKYWALKIASFIPWCKCSSLNLFQMPHLEGAVMASISLITMLNFHQI